jgi:trimeric autotransporter adhesin
VESRVGRRGGIPGRAARAAVATLTLALLASGGTAQAAVQRPAARQAATWQAAARQAATWQAAARLAGATGRGPATAVPGVISTVAGGVGGPGLATGVDVSFPCGVSFGAGALYVAGGQTVRRVNPATDRLTTPAGTDAISPVGDGGPATAANVETCGASAGHDGSLLIANFEDQRIQVVAARSGTFFGQAMTAGDIYTVAGDGTAGFSGDGGPATGAELDFPNAVAADGAGNLIIADSGNNRVRVAAAASGTFYGRAMTAGHIYTVAGGGSGGPSGDGGPATKAGLSAQSVAVDGAGNLVIADSQNGRIRVVAATTGTFYGQAMKAHDIYTVAGGGTSLGDGGPATQAALSDPAAVAVDRAGDLLIADTFDQRVRIVAVSTGTRYGQAVTAGDIYTVAGTGSPGYAGDGGPAAAAEVAYPQGVAVDGSGNLVIADTDNARVRVVAARTGTFYGHAMTVGHIYTVASNGAPSGQDGNQGFSGDAGPALRAELDFPGGVAVDGSGNLVIADTSNNRIRVVAARSGTFYGRSMTAHDIYTVAGAGIRGFSGVGGPATAAKLSGPSDVLPDAAGNLVIADTGNNRIRVVAARSGTFYGQAMTAGHIYTVAGDGARGTAGDGGPALKAGLHSPEGVAVDHAGNLVIADTRNRRVQVVAAASGTFYGQAMTAGDVYTVATLGGPTGVAVDHAGNVVISSADAARVFVLAVTTGTFYGRAMTAGNLYVVAGGGRSYPGNGGPARSAELQGPTGVAVDPAGNLVIADTGDNRVRVVAVTSGTFYGQPMTAGDIYTLAGDANQGYFGDGGPGSGAWVGLPAGVAVDGAGNVLIADSDTGRIREVAG